MGISLTPNLGLIKPDVQESIREQLPEFPGWAAQNAANCDSIDKLFRSEEGSYVPTFGAVITPPTLGTGAIRTGKYVRIGPKMVLVHFRVSMGTTGFLPGDGSYTLTIPPGLPLAPELKTFFGFQTIGKCVLHDFSAVATTTVLNVTVANTSNTTVAFQGTGGPWNLTTPFPIAVSDRVAGYFLYPTSAA